MAAKKKAAPSDAAPAEGTASAPATPGLAKPDRLVKLTIRNLGCIGPKGVSVDLDDIVVLVGPNNVGKSTILRAYQLAMSEGSDEALLTLEDFPGRRFPPEQDQYPAIELETVVVETKEKVGEQYLAPHPGGGCLVRELWTWKQFGLPPVRQGWHVAQGAFVDGMPSGMPHKANARRPKCHRILAFDSPEKQAENIVKLVMTSVQAKVKALNKSASGGATPSEYAQLFEALGAVQRELIKDAAAQTSAIQERMTALIGEVFTDHHVEIDSRVDEDLASAITPFKTSPVLRMGPKGGHLSTVDHQGSGARRVLLWAAIRYAAELGATDADRPQLLLLDEPELCLHPTAIRQACRALYDLAEKPSWQVMVTTHSPAFIDLARDHTTIVRISRDAAGILDSETVFRSDRVSFDTDERRELKLLNAYDPYVGEFFFGGRTIIVEGDTEYTAFRHVIAALDDPALRDAHIVRARGKAVVAMLAKILNTFRLPYSVLHDADSKLIEKGPKKGQPNSAWIENDKIKTEVFSPGSNNVRLVASLPDFERAVFGKASSGDKPYTALRKMEKSEAAFDTVAALLRFLLRDPAAGAAPPAGFLEYQSVDQLEVALSGALEPAAA